MPNGMCLANLCFFWWGKFIRNILQKNQNKANEISESADRPIGKTK